MEINGENGSMTLYDRNGTPAAYIDSDGEHIYLFDGKPAAYLNEDAVYGFGGTQYGWFEKGWIRDLDGYCVMFTDEARTQDRQSPRAMRRRPNGPGQPDR